MALTDRSPRQVNTALKRHEACLGLSGTLGRDLAMSILGAIEKEVAIAAFEESAIDRAVAEVSDPVNYPETMLLADLRRRYQNVIEMANFLRRAAWSASAPRNAQGLLDLIDRMKASIDEPLGFDWDVPDDGRTESVGLRSSVFDGVLTPEKIREINVSVVGAIDAHAQHLIAAQIHLGERRREKIEAAKKQATLLPDDAAVRLVSRYRAESERSLLRKLEAARRIRELMAPRENGFVSARETTFLGDLPDAKPRRPAIGEGLGARTGRRSWSSRRNAKRPESS